MAGIENFLATILCVLIATRKYDGVGPCATTPGDARHQWPMHSGLGEFHTRGKTTPFRITRNMTKGACNVHG
jgi:hypothetical protein